MPRYSIIIVTWNALPHLKTYLPSVAATTYADFEIIIADNASTDGSKQWVRENYPDVKIVTFDHNHGYCGGNNRAVPYATGDVLLFLNNDVKVEPDWLDPLADQFETNKKLAALQPKILSYKNPDEFEYAGASGGFIDKYGYPFCRGRIFDTIEKDEGQYDDFRSVFWASGAALAIRKKIFEELGAFDEDFEFHMEEIDLCWRLWNRGYRIGVCPQSVVYHLGGGSLPMHSPRKLYYNYRNSLTMLWKNYATTSLFLRFPMRLMLDFVAVLREFISGNFKSVKAIIEAHLHFWRSVGKTTANRRELQRKRTNQKDPSLMKPISIIWQYFVRGIKHFSKIPVKKEP